MGTLDAPGVVFEDRHELGGLDMDASMDEAVQALWLARLRIVLRPVGALNLPPQPGSTIRGALAGAVKRLVCVRTELLACDGCPHLDECAYSYLFETHAPQGEAGTRGFEQFPRPYVISFPEAPGGEYAMDAEAPELETCSREIDLTLIGRAVRGLPFLALALRDLENRGIGRGRGRFELSRIDAVDLAGDRYLVYEAGENLLQAQFPLILGSDITGSLDEFTDAGDRRRCTSLALEFVTPTALHFEKRVAARPEFHILVRNLLRRASMLALGHCGHRMDLDFGGWIRAAEKVEIVGVVGRRVEWERHSTRQKQRVPMSGFRGRVEYRGEIGPFLPLLALGSLVHVGDNCAFGMGRYVIEEK
jgi:hypothetical protein